MYCGNLSNLRSPEDGDDTFPETSVQRSATQYKAQKKSLIGTAVKVFQKTVVVLKANGNVAPWKQLTGKAEPKRKCPVQKLKCKGTVYGDAAPECSQLNRVQTKLETESSP